MTTKTELQQAITDAILANKGSDDKEIARIAFSMLNPGEEYKRGCSPSHQYVTRIRGRLSFESQAPEIEVTGEPIPKPPITEEPEPEEPPYTPESFKLPGDETPTKTTEPSLFEGKKIIKVGFDGLAHFTSWEGWKLDPKDDTDAQFIEATDRMIMKYGPEWIEQFGDEIMFGVSTISAVGPRIRDYKKHLDNQKPKPPPPPPQATAEPKATEQKAPGPSTEPNQFTQPADEPRSKGDDEFKRRLGGNLR